MSQTQAKFDHNTETATPREDRVKEITALFDMDGISEAQNATLIAHSACVQNLAEG